jgi:hypothetical protein
MVEETKRLIREELLPEIRNLDRDVKRLRVIAAVMIVALVASALFIWRFVAYSNCTTDRSKALTGPGNERVSLFLGAFTASVTVQHLPAGERAADLRLLRDARGRYPLIPDDAALLALPDARIAGDAEAVRALDKNAEYGRLVKSHPVCSLWGV